MKNLLIICLLITTHLATYLVGRCDGWQQRYEANLPSIDQLEKTISGTLYPCPPEHFSSVFPESFTALDTVEYGMILVRNGADTLGYFSIY